MQQGVDLVDTVRAVRAGWHVAAPRGGLDQTSGFPHQAVDLARVKGIDDAQGFEQFDKPGRHGALARTRGSAGERTQKQTSGQDPGPFVRLGTLQDHQTSQGQDNRTGEEAALAGQVAGAGILVRAGVDHDRGSR
ncbi:MULTISPECIES: hypothetical protein [Promicromonospora]|uniref:Luciferase-like monooxygenase n=1 Tax=Promicromonospora vindobonensis TaxID=195748 RepID=A0ABW5VRZ7_9MICO|nr:hypothetical protein [Promicromonospora umidemergens]